MNEDLKPHLPSSDGPLNVEPAQETYVADHSRHGDINDYLGGVIGEKFLRYRADWKKAQAMELVTDFPLYLTIETQMQCNFRCVMCTYSDPETLAEHQYNQTMSDDLFGRIVGEIKEHGCPSAGVNGVNEPLMDPKIIDRIGMLNEAGVVDIRMNTNASLLTEKRIERLLDSGLTRLMVGIDAATAETYANVRVGGNFEKLERNIERFLNLREKGGYKLPILRVTFVRFAPNEHEEKPFIQKWKDKADQVSIQEYRAPKPGDEIFESRFSGSRRIKPDISCPQPFERLTVRGNGDVLPCCAQYAYSIRLGNITEHTLAELWHSKGEDILRRHMKEKTWSQVPSCNKCLKNLVR